MSPVLNVLLSRIRIIVVLQNQVLVYGFSSPPKKFATYETISNELGLADLSVNSTSFSQPVGPSTSASSSASILSSSSTATNTGVTGGSASKNTSSASSLKSQKPYRDKYQILAFPGRSPGQIQLVDVSPTGQEKNLVSIIKAHKSKIRCLALNRLGTLVASASETGTIIRVHSTYNTALLYEFRRGLDRAIITSMKFSQNDSKLAVLSDKNTLHIFNVTSDPNQEHSTAATMHDIMDAPILPSHPINRQHLLRNLPIPVPNYFKSTWSFCSVNINKYHNEILSDAVVDDEPNIGVLGWSGNDSIVIVWKNKRIWEKYVIVEKSRQTGENEVQWEIIRDSWKSLDVD